MRVLFLGTPEFGIPSLQMLVQEGYEIAGVITQPDRPQGRGHRLVPCPLKQAALELELPVYQYERIRAQEAVEELRHLAPDIMITAAYGQILTQRILDIPPMGVVNVHGSLLPKYRGPAPIQWAVIRGEKETGITTMMTARGVDSGDILLQHPLAIREGETAGELYARMGELGAQVLRETLEGLASGSIVPRPQDEAEATYLPMLEKEHGRIDWTRPAQAIACQVRGVNPWPGAYTAYDGGVMKIWAAVPLPGQGAPGCVVRAGGADGLVVGCGEGLLRVDILQAPGKKAMPASDFLRGRPIPVGTMLGEEAQGG